VLIDERFGWYVKLGSSQDGRKPDHDWLRQVREQGNFLFSFLKFY
jgi:hypothetical protein